MIGATCRNGHPRTPENTLIVRRADRPGRTVARCRPCHTAAVAASAARRAEQATAAGMSHRALIRSRRRADQDPATREARQAATAARNIATRIAAVDAARHADGYRHIVRLDPDPADGWDGLSIVVWCTCGWRDPHVHPATARAAAEAHTTTRLDATTVRGPSLRSAA